MKCRYCNKAIRKSRRFYLRLATIVKGDERFEYYCDWSCVAGYVKETGLLTKDDFQRFDRC
jgi:hypothetical protein